ncbi:MAG: microcompartment protein [Herbinix sp.]|jgi:microcompartment protein CcmL/EutN|nr:microcompartment protein [Herbinix sp.]
MSEAVGLLEVYGLVAAFAAADAGCKAANVRIETFDRNKPANAEKLEVPLIIMVKFRGSVEDTRAALEAGEVAAKRISGVITKHIIARPEEDLNKFLNINGFDKN